MFIGAFSFGKFSFFSHMKGTGRRQMKENYGGDCNSEKQHNPKVAAMRLVFCQVTIGH